MVEKDDLKITRTKVRILSGKSRYGTTERRIYLDRKGQRYVKFNGKFWKYPQEVEF